MPYGYSEDEDIDEFPEPEDEEYNDEDEEEDREGMLPYGARQSSKPFNGEGGRLMIGWEMEVHPEEGMSRAKLIRRVKEKLPAQDSNGPYIICKSDGSIESVRGFEIVSRPASLEAHKKIASVLLEDPPKYLRAHSSRCGLHVHINKGTGYKSLSKLQKAKIRAFSSEPGNQKYIDMVIGRAENSFCRRQIGSTMRVLSERNYDRYSMWNETEKTMEMRGGKATIDPVEFWSVLEFTVAVVEFSNFASVEKSKKIDSFTEWLRARTKEYPNLYAMTCKFFGSQATAARKYNRKAKGEN